MDRAAPLPIIVNKSGGTARGEGDSLGQSLHDAFAKAGALIDLHLVAGREIADTVHSLRSRTRIVVGGGDGTLGGAAGALAGTSTELAILPLGTRNHFARQLRLPLDLEEAARVAATGQARAVDIAVANERTFINNASLGAYVDLVRERDGLSLPKGPASILAGWRVLRRLRPRRFSLVLDGRIREVRTSMLFIGNNRYEIPEGHPGERVGLNDGVLSVFALAPIGKSALVRTAMRVALSKPDMARDFNLDETVRELDIAGSGTIGIALDGERMEMELPLTIKVRAAGLNVVLPNANAVP